MYYSHSGNGSVGLPAGNSVFITQVPDLLSNITDGYGLSISPSYVSTPQSNYTKGTGTHRYEYDVLQHGPIVGMALKF